MVEVQSISKTHDYSILLDETEEIIVTVDGNQVFALTVQANQKAHLEFKIREALASEYETPVPP